MDPVDIADLLTRCRFPAPNSPVACGLSGGPDSTALVALAVRAGLVVTAWHVNHGIRPDADADEAVARETAEAAGADFEVRSVVVEAGSNLEERARNARYAVLPGDVCVGHTTDDRAETVLFNIGRGAGLAGAAAPHLGVQRPLLRLRRWETHALCEQLDLTVVRDSMNDDPTHTRTIIRNDVMPALARALGRDPIPLLARHGDLAADAHEVITGLAAQIDATDADALSDAPRALSSQALRDWIVSETGSPLPVSAASIDRVLAVAAGDRVATEIEGGYRVARSRKRLRLEAP